MPFFEPNSIPSIELMPGVTTRVMSGEKLMLSLVSLKAGAVVPTHSHPHEQSGYVLEGKLEFRIGDQRMRLKPGDAVIVPPNAPHGVTVLPDADALVLDVFSPPREEYLAKAASR